MVTTAPVNALEYSSSVDAWGLSCQDVEVRTANTLTSAAFQADYVNRQQPVLLKGLIDHWPLLTSITDLPALRQRLGPQTFSVHHRPVPELKFRMERWPERFAGADLTGEDMAFDTFADRAERNDFAFSYATSFDAGSKLAPLLDDVGDIDLLPATPPRHYRRMRAFFHARSFTDWHYHPRDETFMCQLGRAKKAFLVPPTQAAWDNLFGIAQQTTYICRGSLDAFPGLKELSPLVVDVEPGDGLYIPPHWWHAVECTGQEGGFGMTIAVCWGSPAHVRFNPTFPHQRFRFAHGGVRQRLKLTAAGAVWAALRVANSVRGSR